MSIKCQFSNINQVNFPRTEISAIISVLLGVATIGFVASAHAQSGPEAGALQQQLQREIDRERPQAEPEPLIKKPAAPTETQANEQTIEVNSFKVTGITFITQEQVQEVLKPYTKRKLTFDQIKEAAATVSSMYTQIGRVAQAVVPPQDVVDGQIWIKVIEGKVGEVIIELDKDTPSRLKPEVIKGFISSNNPADTYVDLNGLERSLALINELPGNEVSGQLSQGNKEETSNIQVNAKDTGLLNGRADASNYGAANTGVAQLTASLSLNNPAGIGDQATLDVIGSLGSIYAQAKYSIPVGYDGWRVAAGVSALDYKTLKSFSSNMSEGTAQTYGIYTTYALERTARSNKTVVINFENKNYNNYSINANTQTSSYQINDLIFGINGNNFIDQAYLNWGATATLGYLTINNTSQANNDLQGAATKGSFGKISFNTSINQPLPIEKTNLMGSIYGQLANKNLNSAEQFYLGGPYGVRAYPIAQGGGAQGAIASVEINHTLENHLQLGAFVDFGVVQQYISTYPNWQGNTNAGNVYPLYATGLLAKYNYEKIQLSAAVAFRLGNNPLYNQSGQQLNVNNQYNPVQAWLKGTIYF